MIRPATLADLPDVARVTMASKAHWGYSQAFLDACRDELSPKPADIGPGLVVWDEDGIQGMAHVTLEDAAAHLWLLFIHPEAIGRGIGTRLFHWTCDHARSNGARRLSLHADPYAVPFYDRMGMAQTGEYPSTTWPGRILPVMSIDL